MRSGKLVHVIEVQRATSTVNAAGTPVDTWTPIATLRAEVVERATQDFLENAGEISTARTVFRTRFFNGLITTDRIAFDGHTFEVEEVTRIGRRTGLEIRCRQIAEETRA
ncbi:phage head closure protein [Roseovarius sp. 217]|uniref:phage head closure protein n=1 Tax=Roseovarius sp. (strain 217) TaxID=314264 RepID=UPI0000687270|nr:phage head closure protein [Roseovarius sp. 217]EAQ23228.1 phage head-tail adaptor, putative [Roseovarius sp. 217]